MAKRCADVALCKKLEILQNYLARSTCGQSVFADELNISRGCELNGHV